MLWVVKSGSRISGGFSGWHCGRLRVWIGDNQDLGVEGANLIQQVREPVSDLAGHIRLMAAIAHLCGHVFDQYDGVGEHKGDSCLSHLHAPAA